MRRELPIPNLSEPGGLAEASGGSSEHSGGSVAREERVVESVRMAGTEDANNNLLGLVTALLERDTERADRERLAGEKRLC